MSAGVQAAPGHERGLHPSRRGNRALRNARDKARGRERERAVRLRSGHAPTLGAEYADDFFELMHLP